MAAHSLSVAAILCIPIAYLACFLVLTFPAVRDFSTHFFVDGGDGLQNAWNLWWVEKAVRSGRNPFFTNYLHFPYGITLLAHTLTPFNGILAIPFRALFGPVRALNIIVIFSFVASGCTAFALAWWVTRRRAASFIAGFIFTFCNYHFAHAEGHLNLISTEWIPLFLLCWCAFLERQSWQRGSASAASLLLVILCDYYYFLFCALAALVLVASQGRRIGTLIAWRNVPGFAAFASLTAATSGPLVWALWSLASRDPLSGSHDPTAFSMDLLAPLLPGGHWHFAEWTQWFWKRLPGNNIHESSVHLGVGVCALAGVGTFASSRRVWIPWVLLAAFFAAMALGPRLQVAGTAFPAIRGPYALLVTLVPSLRNSGCPVRMVIMLPIGLGILAGVGLDRILRSLSVRSVGIAAALLALVAFETWPSPIPRTNALPPPFMQMLRNAPRKDVGLFDVDDCFGATPSLLYQTTHEIPIAQGYVARIPHSVAVRDSELGDLASRRRWIDLCQRHGVQFFVFRDPAHARGLAEAHWFSSNGIHFYDAGKLWRCGVAREPLAETAAAGRRGQ